MKQQLSPGIAIAIVGLVVVVVLGIFWASTRTKPTQGRNPVQASGGYPEQPGIPKAEGP